MTIHPHSSSETYFIYCVGQSQAKVQAFKAAMAHKGIPAKPLLGRYRGRDEHSFISRMSDFNMIHQWLNTEKSILHIHSFDARDRPKATLIYLNSGETSELGRMVPTTREDALREDAYTFDPTYRAYFVYRSI